MFLISLESKFFPWSVLISKDIPYLEIISLTSVLAIVCARAFVSGNTSTHLVNVSVMTKRYLFLFDEGEKGLNISSCKREKRDPVLYICNLLVPLPEGPFLDVQISHDLHQFSVSA